MQVEAAAAEAAVEVVDVDITQGLNLDQFFIGPNPSPYPSPHLNPVEAVEAAEVVVAEEAEEVVVDLNQAEEVAAVEEGVVAGASKLIVAATSSSVKVM